MLTVQFVLKSTWSVLPGKAFCGKVLRAAVRTFRLRDSVERRGDATGLHSSS